MSPRTPRVTAEQMGRVLEKLGFTLTRQSGSHRIYKNPSGKRATLPFHQGKILHPKVVTTIRKDADISPEDLRKLLRS